MSELCAFVSYACSFPNDFIALVDSYSTLQSGVKNFLLVELVLVRDLGYKCERSGIRLDSGDLALLASETRKLYAETAQRYALDFSKLKIIASNDINEQILLQLNQQHH